MDLILTYKTVIDLRYYYVVAFIMLIVLHIIKWQNVKQEQIGFSHLQRWLCASFCYGCIKKIVRIVKMAEWFSKQPQTFKQYIGDLALLWIGWFIWLEVFDKKVVDDADD